jgi:Xaa-Pro aminopeptidase
MSTQRVSNEIYQLRFEKIQQFLEEEGLGALFVYSPPMEHKWGQTGHVSYLSGWADHDRIVDSAAVVPRQGTPVLLFAGMPYMRELALEVSSLDDVRLVGAIDPNAVAVDPRKSGAPRSFTEEALAILQENGLGGKDIGVVGIENIPTLFYQSLSEGLGEKFKPVRDIVAELRYAKSPDEVGMMRHAARLSDLGFETMLKTAKPGLRGIEIVAEMERAIRREGADHAKYWLASGPPPDWSNVKLEVKPHMRVLEEGDLMAACSYVVYKGYWCHGQRTGVLQRPCAELERICGITQEAQEAGLAVMKPGTPVGHIARTIREKAAEHSWEIQGGRIGHGIGLDYSERPNMTESNETPLKAGTTAVVHATFSLPGSGVMFVPLGDVCHVTEEGPELLMSFPRTPFVAGQ